VDSQTRERLEFQYNPSAISDEKSTAYAVVQIPGMSHPRYQYVSGEARKIALKIELFKGPVKQKAEWLQSLLYPELAGTMLKDAPHPVILVFGDLYPGILCVVRSVNVKYFGLFDTENLLPQRAEIDIALEEIVESSVNWKDIRK
jgi:hypothetical protein